MEKVKIFTGATGNTFEELEKEVNQWLRKQNRTIQIIVREVRTISGTNLEGHAFINCTIVIFYHKNPTP
ncbi:hypothetical protein C4546_03400 [Candidatus Parcubacteria bacterium]|nr:MAG: hypothetical protein C4546_03400 [Candidatus Parcubacteria bacterium]